MKTRPISTYTSLIKISFITMLLGGCATITDIVPQLPSPGSANSQPVVGQDIAQANAFLNAGKKREAADIYFRASQNYRSPERERLILQAAELASVFKDPVLTQQYLAPVNFDRLNPENQMRFRLVQAQLALNDRNYRETLRILPQRVNNIPPSLGQKILTMRMNAAQSSGDKIALIQELVLQEATLTESYQVSLNHDRIWGHAQQIPSFQLEEAKNSIGHPIVKNWLELAQLSRIAKNGSTSKRQSLRSDLGRWIQNNTNHPGMTKALGLLNTAPTTTITAYRENVKKPVVNRPPVVKTPVLRKPAVKPPVAKPRKETPPVVKTPIKKDPNVKSLYEKIKEQIANDSKKT